MRRLVLVGGGHTHVQVLKAFAMEPPPATELAVVVDRPIAVYSGMVPGFVSGQYRNEELEIDVVPLARRARARVILAPATRIDAAARMVHLAGRPPLPYDVASVDIGSTVAGLGLPGVAEHALATRPINRFVQELDARLETARQRRGSEPMRLVVVGGGAGGVEVAFALRHRLVHAGVHPLIRLVHGGERILPGDPSGRVQRVERAAARAGIEMTCGRKVTAAVSDEVHLDDGTRLACDVLVWVTGAVGHSFWRDSDLETDARGFVFTRPTLLVDGHDDLFAVGDCATLRAFPRTPKAGVYAVRQGPYLIDNLRAWLQGGSLRHYRPQRDFLALLNLGDGTAIGGKWGRSFEGRWVMRLKDRIDRRFMKKFQVLSYAGGLTRVFRAQPDMAEAMGEMLCGGCAAKVGQHSLDRVLDRLAAVPADATVVLGVDDRDDVAAVQVPGGDLVVSTIDAFRAFTNDPYLVGRVAVANAVSDVYAKGVIPRHALALVALPQDATPEVQEATLFEVLTGVRAALDALGISLIGGHTMTAPELLVGLTVQATVTDATSLMRKGGLQPGHKLILTKPLGTGVLFHADAFGKARGPWIATALEFMTRPNAGAANVAREQGVAASTDVTGFGLAGHLGEMTRASAVSTRIQLDALPALPGAVPLLALGERSTFHDENARARRGMAIARSVADRPEVELLFDPQTSGGLLLACEPQRAEALVAALHAGGDTEAAIIGEVLPARDDGAPIAVR